MRERLARKHRSDEVLKRQSTNHRDTSTNHRPPPQLSTPLHHQPQSPLALKLSPPESKTPSPSSPVEWIKSKSTKKPPRTRTERRNRNNSNPPHSHPPHPNSLTIFLPPPTPATSTKGFHFSLQRAETEQFASGVSTGTDSSRAATSPFRTRQKVADPEPLPHSD